MEGVENVTGKNNYIIFNESSFFEIIFYGVIAGVTTAFFLWLFKLGYERLRPEIESWLYRGLIIKGVWYESHNVNQSGFIQESTITLKQKAYRISGNVILVKYSDKEKNKQFDLVKSFKVEGRLYNGFLNLNCYNTDDQFVGVHNYLLKIEFDGRSFKGKKTYYETLSQKIISETIYWSRESQQKSNEEEGATDDESQDNNKN